MPKITELEFADLPLPAGSVGIVSVPRGDGSGEYDSRKFLIDDDGIAIPIAYDLGSLDASVPLADLEEEWNNALIAFVGERRAITGTAYDVASVAYSYELDGSRKYALNPFGGIVQTFGVVATNDKAIFSSLNATWNDGFAPGDPRVLYDSINVNITMANVGDKYHSFFKGSIDGTDIVKVIAPTIYNGGVVRSGVIFYNPDAAADTGALSHCVGAGVALCHGIDPGSGNPARVAQFYFDNVATQDVAVMASLATSRFQIQSAGAMVHVSANGRYEWEAPNGTPGITRITNVGYFLSEHKPIDFNNNSGGGTAQKVPLSASTVDQSVDAFQVCYLNTGLNTWTPLTRFDGYGRIFAPAIVSLANTQAAPGTALTASTAETTLATFSIPAGSMGPHGQVEIETFISCNASAGTKTLRIYFGGAQFYSFSPTAVGVGVQQKTRVANKTAGTQIGYANSTTGTGFGVTTAATFTASVDTTAAVTVTLTGQLSNGADNMALESYIIKTTYGA